MPDYRLKSFRVRSGVRGVNGWNDHASIGYLRGIAAVAANYANNLRPYRFRIIQSGYQIRTNILFDVSAADRQDQKQIVPSQATDPEPAVEDGTPTFIIGPRRK